MEDSKKDEEKSPNNLINKKRRRKQKEKAKNKDNDNKNNSNNTENKKEQRKTKKKILNEYYNLKPVIKIENNVRLIEPYEFKYQLYIKRRWLGKKLLEVLLSEFHLYSKDYFINAINDKKILINEKPTKEDYILKDNDFLTHLTIRKENPIIFKKLEIIFEDNDYLVVDKPSSCSIYI